MSASSHFCNSSPLSRVRVLRPVPSVPPPAPVPPPRPSAPGPDSTAIAAARRGPASGPTNIRYHSTPSATTRIVSAAVFFGSLRRSDGSQDVHPAAVLLALLSVLVDDIKAA